MPEKYACGSHPLVVWFSIIPHGYLRRETRMTSDPILINMSTQIT